MKKRPVLLLWLAWAGLISGCQNIHPWDLAYYRQPPLHTPLLRDYSNVILTTNDTYFGFTGPETFPIDPFISNLRAADLDGDGLNDLIIVNNSRSKITLLYNQTGKTNPAAARRNAAAKRELNELPPDARFRVDSIASEKRIAALVVADLNGDGRPDIAYYGEPKELVVQYNEGTNGWSSPKRWPIEDGQLSPNALRIALGVFVLILVAYKRVSDRIKSLEYQPRFWHATAAGALAGLASGLFNNGGPPFNSYLLLQKMPPRTFIATTALFFALVNLIKLAGFLYTGVLNRALLLSRFMAMAPPREEPTTTSGWCRSKSA